MKKILLPILLLTLLFTTLGCNQSPYALKKLIVHNATSDVNLTNLAIRQEDGAIVDRVTFSSFTPVIYAGDTKEYAIPYLPSEEVSSVISVRVQGEDPSRRSSRDFLSSRRPGPSIQEYIFFTFNTSINEDIIITFIEATTPSTGYELKGVGSGFSEIEMDD